MTRGGSQIAPSIDENIYLGNIVFFGESMQERRSRKLEISDVLARISSRECRGLSPAATKHVHLQQRFRLSFDRVVDPFLLAI